MSTGTLISDDVITRLMHLPLRARRRALRVVWRVARSTRIHRQADVHEIVIHLLGSPIRQAKQISSEFDFMVHLRRLESKILTSRPIEALIKDAANTCIINEPWLTRVADDPRGALISPLHMGAYGLPLGYLIHRFFPGRPVLILRSRADSRTVEQTVGRLMELKSTLRFLDVGDKSFGAFKESLAWARRKRAITIAFADLPAGQRQSFPYGPPTRIEIFRTNVLLALGHHKLARLLDAWVVPVAIATSITGDSIEVRQPFEIQDQRSLVESPSVDHFRSHLETSLKSYPEQWHMWPRLPDYFQGGASTAPVAR